ncbi:MAG: transcriptional repressor LexA [Spirochaetaceae bacterium]|nr:MAG: transcriptional repressor LexA [Spirochaetaceae bacterium]
MKSITRRQREVLDYIKAYITGHKFPPTFREISENFSISVKGAYDHVKALERKGFIQLNNNRSRTIEVLDNAEQDDITTAEVPILGKVAAGRPLFTEENYEGTIRLPSEYTRGGKNFALNVQGDSMRDAGIHDGDIAVFVHQNVADNGDIVVAMVDEAMTLKRFYKEKNRVKLQAENPEYPPIYTRDVRILGRLTHLIRSYV